jgi:hypothetical protein
MDAVEGWMWEWYHFEKFQVKHEVVISLLRLLRHPNMKVAHPFCGLDDVAMHEFSCRQGSRSLDQSCQFIL